MLLMGNHHIDSTLHMIMMVHVYAQTRRLSLGRLTCLDQTCAIRENDQAPRKSQNAAEEELKAAR